MVDGTGVVREKLASRRVHPQWVDGPAMPARQQPSQSSSRMPLSLPSVAKWKQRRLVLARRPPRVAFSHGAFPQVVSPAEAQAPDPLVESSLDPLTLGTDPLIGN